MPLDLRSSSIQGGCVLLAVLAASAAVQTSAQAEALLPAGWTLSKDVAGCTLRAGTASGSAEISIKPTKPLSISATVPVIARQRLRDFPGADKDGIGLMFGPPVWWIVSTIEGGPSLPSLSAKRIDDSGPVVRAELFGTLDDTMIRQLSAQPEPKLFIRGKVLKAQLGVPAGLDRAVAALAACSPVLRQPNLPVRAIGDTAKWVRAEELPDWLSQPGISGWRASRFALTVGPDGRVGECRVEWSTGHDRMDDKICRDLRARGRFDPASDTTGRAVAARYYYALPAGRDVPR